MKDRPLRWAKASLVPQVPRPAIQAHDHTVALGDNVASWSWRRARYIGSSVLLVVCRLDDSRKKKLGVAITFFERQPQAVRGVAILPGRHPRRNGGSPRVFGDFVTI